MSLRDLSGLFRPRSVAIFGVDSPDSSLGAAVARNIKDGGFAGPVMLVRPGDDIGALPSTPDLAILCGPVDEAAATLKQLASRGIRAALVLSGTGRSEAPALAAREIALAARQNGIRLIGPDCFGIQVPSLKLNASVSPVGLPPAGGFGCIVQSTTVCAAALDWARQQGIGFSTAIGLGHMLDVDFGDALDYLGSDPDTQAILVIIETIRERGEFIAAARAAARNKPVLAMKIGQPTAGEADGGSHAGALAGTDAVYDAVFRRAGILRVTDVRELFMAAQTLTHTTPVGKGALAVVANGHGIGTLASDQLSRRGGTLARLSPATHGKLLPLASGGKPGNPLDLGPDADKDRYRRALESLLDAPEIETILAMHVPTVLADSMAAAEAVIAAQRGRRSSVIACWIGQETAAPARAKLRDAGIATYETTADAVRAYMHLVEHRRGQDMLMETPPSTPEEFKPDTARVRSLVARVVGGNRFVLSEPEAKAVIGAYGIKAVPTEIASSPAEAGRIARRLDQPVALKILSPDISHKSIYGGVMLDLPGAFEVEKAGYQMIGRVAMALPTARIEGFVVEPMARSPGAVEIMIGIATDPVFGPVILFGQGGVAAEAIGDVAIGLPPLNMSLAREMVQRAHVAKQLSGHLPADIDAICLALVQVSQLAVDIPEILEMDINPLFADADGVLALDARIALAPAPENRERLAIRPYPQELEEIVAAKDGRRILLRPIRPEDEPNHYGMISRMTKEDLRFRFFTVVSEVPHSQMARLTQIDYVREMAFVAVPADDPSRETYGVVRLVADADNHTAEYAILVRSDVKGLGLGHVLMDKVIRYARGRGLKRMMGEVLSENMAMLHLAEKFGFRRQRFVQGEVIEVALDLHTAPGRPVFPNTNP